MCSLDIDSNVRAKGPMPERFRELEDYWNESQGNLRLGAHATDGWIAEYSQHREKHDNPDSWANSFEQQYGVNGWVSEFERVRYCIDQFLKVTTAYVIIFNSFSLDIFNIFSLAIHPAVSIVISRSDARYEHVKRSCNGADSYACKYLGSKW